jgi:hypothetical protein
VRPFVLYGFVMAAEHGQQFAMLRPEVVAGLNAEAAFGPGQRRRGVVLRGQDGGHREAVLGGQAGSFRQRDVRAGIALGDVDSTKRCRQHEAECRSGAG